MSRKSSYRKYMAADGRVLLGVMVNKKFPHKIAYGGQLYHIPYNYPAGWTDAKVRNWTTRDIEAKRHQQPDNPESEKPESD